MKHILIYEKYTKLNERKLVRKVNQNLLIIKKKNRETLTLDILKICLPEAGIIVNRHKDEMNETTNKRMTTWRIYFVLFTFGTLLKNTIQILGKFNKYPSNMQENEFLEKKKDELLEEVIVYVAWKSTHTSLWISWHGRRFNLHLFDQIITLVLCCHRKYWSVLL